MTFMKLSTFLTFAAILLISTHSLNPVYLTNASPVDGSKCLSPGEPSTPNQLQATDDISNLSEFSDIILSMESSSSNEEPDNQDGNSEKLPQLFRSPGGDDVEEEPKEVSLEQIIAFFKKEHPQKFNTIREIDDFQFKNHNSLTRKAISDISGAIDDRTTCKITSVDEIFTVNEIKCIPEYFRELCNIRDLPTYRQEQNRTYEDELVKALGERQFSYKSEFFEEISKVSTLNSLWVRDLINQIKSQPGFFTDYSDDVEEEDIPKFPAFLQKFLLVSPIMFQ